MSTGSPKLARREQAIEATRRRLRRLEIETHRIKADLARLEADYEDDVADWLSRKVRRRVPAGSSIAGVVSPKRIGAVRSDAPALDRHTPSTAAADVLVDGVQREVARPRPTNARSAATVDDTPITISLTEIRAAPGAVGSGRRNKAQLRKAASPLLCSFALHAVILSLCVTFTIATIVRDEIPLLSTPGHLDEVSVDQFDNVEIPITRFEDQELQNVTYEKPEFNLADNAVTEVEPAEFGVGTQALGEIGQLDALPSELGTLMAGAGSPGGGEPGGAPGEAIFFGARSKGDRFVFVVDNSSSMKGGRLEAATVELLNAVNALTPKQSFYVIFVSDQTYPMFFPVRAPDLVPATPENRKRLAQWLPKAILASGNNRKLIEAMDMAAALQPHAVFLLWDGDMKYSEKVRLDVMTHLTQPNLWNFQIHTLGMGVTSLDAEQNLTTIANAHGGTFRRVDVPTNRGR
jgi:hypothetical protein